MLMSQLLVVDASGQRLLHKKYRQDISNEEAAIQGFCTEVSNVKQPVSCYSGVYFYHVKRQGIYFVAVCCKETTAVGVLEFLTRLYHIFKDFCGVVNDESITDNIVLLYEVLDEIIDNGYIQQAATEKIKPYIHSDPILHRSAERKAHGLFGMEQRAVSGSDAARTVIATKTQQELRQNEVYVDVVEKISAVIMPNGSCDRCEVEGQVSMKCFLTAAASSSPMLMINLNEDLIIDADSVRGYGEMAKLDECTYHESVDHSDPRSLLIAPSEGQFCVMSYRVRGDLPHGLPIHLDSYINTNNSDMDVHLKLRCPFASAVNVTVSIAVPHHTTGVLRHELGEEERVDYSPQSHTLTWSIKKLHGETIARIQLENAGSDTRLLGPAHLDFELSNFVCSNLKIRAIKLQDCGSVSVPTSWIRYITTRDSYVCKLV